MCVGESWSDSSAAGKRRIGTRKSKRRSPTTARSFPSAARPTPRALPVKTRRSISFRSSPSDRGQIHLQQKRDSEPGSQSGAARRRPELPVQQPGRPPASENPPRAPQSLEPVHEDDGKSESTTFIHSPSLCTYCTQTGKSVKSGF